MRDDDELHWPLNSRPSIHPLADPDFDWDYWMSSEDPPPRPVSPKAFRVGQAHKYQVDPRNLPSTSGYAPSPPEPEHEVVTLSPPSSNLGSPKEPEDEMVPGPPSSPDPELRFDNQSLNVEQPVDLQAAISGAKG
jgi:hypothetical protein